MATVRSLWLTSGIMYSMWPADNPSQSCKFNFRSGKIERSIASRENDAFVPLSPGKIDLEIELKTKGVHQTKIKFASI